MKNLEALKQTLSERVGYYPCDTRENGLNRHRKGLGIQNRRTEIQTMQKEGEHFQEREEDTGIVGKQ